MYFSSEKAQNKLGYASGEIGSALELAVREALEAKGGA
jgi:hypothetical protein